MFEYPQRKKYNLKLQVDKEEINIKYIQATAEDSMDYFEIIQSGNIENIKKYWKEFVEKSMPSGEWYRIAYNIRLKKILHKVESQIYIIIPQLADTIHRVRKSVYTGLPQAKSKGSKKTYFDNTYELITESTMIPSDKIYNRLTIEQVGWWLDKIRFDYYNTFKEGENVNAMIRKAQDKEKYENIAKMVEAEFSKLPKK